MGSKEVDRDIVKKLRVNREIRAREVRLVGDKGEQLGVLPIDQAQDAARRQNLDLVEVAPTAAPPVCRLLDYGKYKYEQAKKERLARKSQKVSLLREVRIRPKIGDHDFEAKARTARKLLDGGDKVKVSVLFRGREITHPDIGLGLLKRMADTVSEVAAPERQPAMYGRRMIMILAPGPVKKAAKEVKEKGDQDAKN